MTRQGASHQSINNVGWRSRPRARSPRRRSQCLQCTQSRSLPFFDTNASLPHRLVRLRAPFSSSAPSFNDGAERRWERGRLPGRRGGRLRRRRSGGSPDRARCSLRARLGSIRLPSPVSPLGAKIVCALRKRQASRIHGQPLGWPHWALMNRLGIPHSVCSTSPTLSVSRAPSQASGWMLSFGFPFLPRTRVPVHGLLLVLRSDDERSSCRPRADGRRHPGPVVYVYEYRFAMYVYGIHFLRTVGLDSCAPLAIMRSGRQLWGTETVHGRIRARASEMSGAQLTCRPAAQGGSHACDV